MIDPEIEKIAIESAEYEKKKKPKKWARSQAEARAVQQRNVQIVLVATNVLLSALIALRTFGIL